MIDVKPIKSPGVPQAPLTECEYPECLKMADMVVLSVARRIGAFCKEHAAKVLMELSENRVPLTLDALAAISAVTYDLSPVAARREYAMRREAVTATMKNMLTRSIVGEEFPSAAASEEVPAEEAESVFARLRAMGSTSVDAYRTGKKFKPKR